MSELIIGTESVFFSLALSAILILHASLFIPVLRRSFKLNTVNRWNTLLLIVLAYTIAIWIALPFSATIFYLYMPLNYYACVVAGTLPLIFFIIAKFKKKTADEEAYNQKLGDGLDLSKDKSLQDTHNFTPGQEMKRKMFHLLAILYVATWILEPLVFYGVGYLYQGISNTPSPENFYNSALLFNDSDVEQILLNGLAVQFFMIICIFIGNMDIELMRLRFNQYSFPMKKLLQVTRRPTEILDTSASMLLLVGLGVSSLILTYTSNNRIAGVYAQMGVICIAVFSDMFAALIGRKWGKHKWRFVKGKSVEGTIAGLSVGFFTAVFFVGPILALIGVGIFTLTDLALDKIKLSDNALNPIFIALAYKALIFLVNPIVVLLPIIKVW